MDEVIKEIKDKVLSCTTLANNIVLIGEKQEEFTNRINE